MRSESDGDFEGRLRRVLREHRQTRADVDETLARVHDGARRRQRRRATVSAVAAVVLVVGGGSFAVHQFAGRSDGGTVVAGRAPTSPVAALTNAPTPAHSPPVSPTTARDFGPVSVTGIGPTTWWVLQLDLRCQDTSCLRVLRTTDNGAHFTPLAAPLDVYGPAHDTDGAAPTGVSDIRFATARDGWAFGGGLWATHDGAKTWHKVAMPGPVLDLQASHGTAWALVAGTSGTDVYRSNYAVGGDAWTRVALPVTLDATPVALAVQASTAVVVGADTTGRPRTLVSVDGGAFTAHPGPALIPDLGAGPISASATGLWIVLPTGSLAGLARSADPVAGWHGVPIAGMSSSVSIGARDATHAVIGTPNGLKIITSSGTVTPVGPAGGSMTWSFIGFTNTQDGFAIGSNGTLSTLWRTTDGGATWHAVTF